ncbi:glycosyltransferase [Massilia horti]|uniref:Glycosyltransferase n=2 Tax=Massilia horti TaxID=2562153 RepID=A0A4Y9T132_9BURK|nr:glycosyltransferase [Massilia horti]
MVKRVLMIAFHFPPLRGSSGIQRTLKFAQYLLGFGWNPVVLSAHPRAFANVGDDQLRDIPAEVPVHRAFALDTSRHLALRGRYLGLLALPDRWVSWCLGAVPAGLRLARRYRPDVIWSTYPIASAHLIGLFLHRLTGIPWVADLRDPMTDESYPSNPLVRRVYGWIEKQTVARCSVAVCTTPGTIRIYQARFPDIPAERFALIENGYDEENFAQAELAPPPGAGAPFVLVHSGVIYPSERDPVPLFAALAELQAQGTLSAANFRLVLRATGHDEYLAQLVKEHGIGELVALEPHLPYRAALAEMLGAGGLLVLQASNCNHQIPAKLYEYLRAGRPILALTDPLGDTAAALRSAGIDTIAPLDSKEAIGEALAHFVPLAQAGRAPVASNAAVAANSRQARTAQLARLLDRVARINRGE